MWRTVQSLALEQHAYCGDDRDLGILVRCKRCPFVAGFLESVGIK